MAEPALSARTSAAAPAPTGLDWADLQGILRFGHGQLTEASFFLLEIADPAAARDWLRNAPVTSAVAADPPPRTALQVAFTRQGLEALGLPQYVIQAFSHEFLAGMAGEESRSRRLGDLGANAPAAWQWGGGAADVPHLVAMVYAARGGLAAWEEAVQTPPWGTAFRVRARLPTSDLRAVEPFGFADGLSQPRPDWERTLRVGKEEAVYRNRLALGEIVLGYPDEYGEYLQRPLLDPAADPAAAALPAAEDAPEKRDLGRNGSYLVFRQLHQDVRGFWQFVDHEADAVPEERWRLAEAMVGRTRTGEPLVPPSAAEIPGVGPGEKDIAANRFTYAADPDGVRCPFGAHVRRANPRTGDLPPGTEGPIARLLRTLGFMQDTFRDDLVASTRFHRILRRGREYGTALSPEEALQPGSGDEERGLHFICLCASISRQFEFVQNAWIASPKFNGLTDESDPLLGNRVPLPGNSATDVFSLPRPDGPARRVTGLPQFVTVRGGAYFFLPGIRALRYIAGETS
jgi:Dyp-type peroxidase family